MNFLTATPAAGGMGSTVIMMVMIMGLVFEMPILAWLLSCLGLVDKSFLQKYKSYAVVGLMVLSAVITPSGDPFTLAVVFTPLYLLYEVGILFAGRAKK